MIPWNWKKFLNPQEEESNCKKNIYFLLYNYEDLRLINI